MQCSPKDVVSAATIEHGWNFQDIPKLPDHAASRTFFTWYVNRAAVIAKLVSDWLKAAGNIRARLAHVFNEHSQARVYLTRTLVMAVTAFWSTDRLLQASSLLMVPVGTSQPNSSSPFTFFTELCLHRESPSCACVIWTT